MSNPIVAFLSILISYCPNEANPVFIARKEDIDEHEREKNRLLITMDVKYSFYDASCGVYFRRSGRPSILELVRNGGRQGRS